MAHIGSPCSGPMWWRGPLGVKEPDRAQWCLILRMFEQTSLPESRNASVDWMLRGAIAIAFVIFGLEKFPADSSGSWVSFFQEVGAGQWFRYLTGVVEVLGGLLVLIPGTAMLGLTL